MPAEIETYWTPIRMVRSCTCGLPPRTQFMQVQCPTCSFKLTINSYNDPCAWQCFDCHKTHSNPFHQSRHFGDSCYYRSGFTPPPSDDEQQNDNFASADEGLPEEDAEDEEDHANEDESEGEELPIHGTLPPLPRRRRRI